MEYKVKVYCKKSPNFFINAIAEDGTVFTFLNNNYWVKLNSTIEQVELDSMVLVDTCTIFARD